MRNLDQQGPPAKNGATSAVATKTKYRDFNDFLGSRKNGNEDEASKSGPKVPYSSYKEFLENYSTRRFSSVKPAVPLQKTMKSEIFIQVNGDSDRKQETSATPGRRAPLEIKVEVSPENKPQPVTTLKISKNSPTLPPPPQFSVNSTPPPPPPPPEALYNQRRSAINGSSAPPKNAPAPPPQFAETKTFDGNSPPVPEFLENLLKKRVAASQGEINTTTYVPVVDETDRVDKNDPNVKKLVYNTYRGLLGAYNHKANDIISTLPRHCVREDRGIAKQLESIA